MANFLTNLDLKNNQLQNAVVHPLGAAPANPVDGQIYYNSTNGNKTLFIYDGAVANAGTALATGDQIYDFVTGITDGQMTSFTVAGDSGSTLIEDSNTLTFDGVDGLTAAVTTDKVTISRGNKTRTNTTSTASPANGATFTVIDSVTTDSKGDVTASNLKTITLPTQTVGTVTSVGLVEGNLIDITGTSPITSSGSWTIDVDLSELSTTTLDADVDFIPIVDGTAQKKIAPVNIPLSKWGGAEANIDMNNNKIVELATPTVGTDAATKQYVDDSVVGGLIYQGGYNAATNTPNLDATPISGIKKGWTYTVTADGLFFTEQVRVGDVIIAEQNTPTVLADWTTVQSNVDLATTTEVGVASFSSTNFAVSAAGQVTVKDNGIILGTETTGNYVGTVTTGAGLDGSSASEGGTAAITLDLAELAAATPAPTDYVSGTVGGVTKKMLVSDIATSANITFAITGNGSTSVFTKTHSLGFGVSVEVYDNKAASPTYGESVYVDVKRVATGTQFTFGTAPATGSNYVALITPIG